MSARMQSGPCSNMPWKYTSGLVSPSGRMAASMLFNIYGLPGNPINWNFTLATLTTQMKNYFQFAVGGPSPCSKWPLTTKTACSKTQRPCSVEKSRRRRQKSRWNITSGLVMPSWKMAASGFFWSPTIPREVRFALSSKIQPSPLHTADTYERRIV